MMIWVKRAIFLLFMIGFPALSFAQPRIEFEKESVDLGEVEPETVTYSFEFRNAGTSVLSIDKIVPS